MSQPLDYRGPERKDAKRVAHRPMVAEVIPIEFDTLLTRTRDSAAVRAVEVELKRRAIDVFRTHIRNGLERWIELHVRASDREQATSAAAEIFARRANLKMLTEPPARPTVELNRSSAVDFARLLSSLGIVRDEREPSGNVEK